MRPGQGGGGGETSNSWSFSFPGGEEKPVNDSGLPDVEVSGGGKLARVAGEDSGVVRQVVIEAKICALRINERQPVTFDRVAAKALIHAKNRLDAPNVAVKSSKGLAAVGCLNPITLCVVPASKL